MSPESKVQNPKSGKVPSGEQRPGLWTQDFGLRTLDRSRAFSLLEVMIALGIFFMAVFAILGLVSSTLKNARSLERPQVDAGLAAAMFTNTNHFTEGSFDGDFGDALQGYSWEAETYEFASNGLVQADIILNKRGSSQPADTLSILMWDPNFKSSSLPSGAKLR